MRKYDVVPKPKMHPGTLAAPTRYRGKPGMSGLCKGLIQGVEESVLTNKSGTMVTGLEKCVPEVA